MNRRSAFTLVELMVALVFMASAAAVMLSAISSSHWQSGTAKYRAVGLSLAHNAIEQRWMQARSGTIGNQNLTTTPATGLPVTFTVNRVTTHITTAGISGLYSVSATVTWPNVRGHTETVYLETLIRDWDE